MSHQLRQFAMIRNCRLSVPQPASATNAVSARLSCPVRPATSRRATVSAAVAVDVEPAAAAASTLTDMNQIIREGDYEAPLVKAQILKQDKEQPLIASVLKAADPSKLYDVCVVGAGPAGMFLAAELGKRGISVAIVGRDLPFTNNYGVWMDEYKELGMEHTIECSFKDTLCYLGEGKEVRIGRAYGRVSRVLLRQHLLKVCKDAGVEFLGAEVESMETNEDQKASTMKLGNGMAMQSRMITLAAGAAGGKFLKFEEGAPMVAAQTAYGIEAEVEGYDHAYSPDLMTFMDFRRHHSGLWEGGAKTLEAGKHPNAGDGLWGTEGELPSFLYAIPLGGNRVFVEETCLVAKPALPFAVLKRRLMRRMEAMNIKVKEVHEEEWSYIPVGGPLPVAEQNVTAFGAAARLVHPATGFSLSRSIREAPTMAEELAAVIKADLSVPEASKRVWDTLWSQEKRTQATFHVFGMELLAALNLQSTNNFFSCFFGLPPFFWRGFLASTLTTTDLVFFALVTFIYANMDIRGKLVRHLFTDPAGGYLINAYNKLWFPEVEEEAVEASRQ